LEDNCTVNKLSYFLDVNALKVMLVLYRDNPDVPFSILAKETKLEENALAELLNSLIAAELIKIKSVKKKILFPKVEGLFTLSREARMSLNRLNAGTMLAK
jgi:hypothetical protein